MTSAEVDLMNAARLVRRTATFVVMPDGSEIEVAMPNVADVTSVLEPPSMVPPSVVVPGPATGFFAGSWRTTFLGYAKAVATILATFILIPDMTGLSDDRLPFAQILGTIFATLQAAKGHVEKDRKAVTEQE